MTSTPGKGSRFAFSVAFTVPTQREDVTAPASTAASSAALAGRRVLIVDDNATNLRILSMQLTRYDMSCTTVEVPADALALVADGAQFDVAVLDMHMPGMDGVELSAELRGLPGGRELPLVLLTSLGDVPKSDRPFIARMLTKPVKSLPLLLALTDVLGGAGPAAPVLHAAHTPSEPSRRLRVLLVEDNSVNQKVAQLMLKKLGHFVDTVGNGLEAVQTAHSAAYDVILMDVQMPVMDGLEATRQIRAQLAAERQPHIVAMTASVLVEDQRACLVAGMNTHLSKPVRQAALRECLELVPVRVETSDHVV